MLEVYSHCQKWTGNAVQCHYVSVSTRHFFLHLGFMSFASLNSGSRGSHCCMYINVGDGFDQSRSWLCFAAKAEREEKKAKQISNAGEPEPPMWRYKAWLGYWEDDFDNITNVIELMLQVLIILTRFFCVLLKVKGLELAISTVYVQCKQDNVQRCHPLFCIVG